MSVSPRQAGGFALAAAVARDRGGARAQAGLSDAVRGDWVALPRELQGLPTDLRRQRLSALVQPAIQPEASQPDHRNARALALLSSEVEPATGRAWLARGGLPMAGFVPDPALLHLLRVLASDRKS